MNTTFSKKFLARYSIKSVVGTGSMGVVYKGVDKSLERDVAVKVLHPHLMDKQSLARFSEEGRVCGALSHENIITLYETDVDVKTPYLVFEYVNGSSIRDVIQKKENIPVSRILKWSTDISSALFYAHEKGIVHRDIKPDNILLDSNGVPKIGDFGIARALSERSCKTKTGIILGTVAYMAPEQITNSIPSPSIDIYAMGVVMYELFTGQVPFSGTAMEMATAILRESPRDVREWGSQVPESIAVLIHKCLEKNPSDRFETAHNLAESLLNIQSQQKTPSVSRTAGKRRANLKGTSPSINASAIASSPIQSTNVSISGEGKRKSVTSTSDMRKKIVSIGGILLFALCIGLFSMSWFTRPALTKEPSIAKTQLGGILFQWETSIPVRTRAEVRKAPASASEEAKTYVLEPKVDRLKKVTVHSVSTMAIDKGDYEFRPILGQGVKGPWMEFSSEVDRLPKLIATKWESSERISLTYSNLAQLTYGSVTFTGFREPNSIGSGFATKELNEQRGAVSVVTYENPMNLIRPVAGTLKCRWESLFRSGGEGSVDYLFDSFSDSLIKKAMAVGMKDRLTPVFQMEDELIQQKMIKSILNELGSKSSEPRYIDLIKAFSINATKFFNHDLVKPEKKMDLYNALIPFLFFEKMCNEQYKSTVGEAAFRGFFATKAINSCCPVIKALYRKEYSEISVINEEMDIRSQAPEMLVVDLFKNSQGGRQMSEAPNKNNEATYLKIQLSILKDTVYVQLQINSNFIVHIFRRTERFSPSNAIDKGVKNLWIRLPDGLIIPDRKNTVGIKVKNWPWLKANENDIVKIGSLSILTG